MLFSSHNLKLTESFKPTSTKLHTHKDKKKTVSDSKLCSQIEPGNLHMCTEINHAKQLIAEDTWIIVYPVRNVQSVTCRAHRGMKGSGGLRKVGIAVKN